MVQIVHTYQIAPLVPVKLVLTLMKWAMKRHDLLQLLAVVPSLIHRAEFQNCRLKYAIKKMELELQPKITYCQQQKDLRLHL